MRNELVMTLPETGDRGTTFRAPAAPNPVIPEGMGPLLDALRARGVAVLFVMDEPDTDDEGAGA